MKLFLDTASIDGIRYWHKTGLIDGITTNPSNLAKEGKNPREVVKQICSLVHDGYVNVEVTETDPESVYKQAKEITKLADNVIVKIPCHRNYYEIIKKLVEKNIPLNITLVFTLAQSLCMCKLGVRYISPFIGRWDDIDIDGTALLYEIRQMVDKYSFKTEILAASLRTVRHVHDVILAGADVATIPLEIMNKITEHPLTNQGMEKFLSDWKKLEIKNFP